MSHVDSLGASRPHRVGDRLRDAYGVTAEFLSDIISETCRRFPSTEGSAKAARVGG
jgi:hypothetical protein